VWPFYEQANFGPENQFVRLETPEDRDFEPLG